MLQAPRSSLAMYLIDLQSQGRITFTRDEAIAALGVSEGAFLKAAGRLQQRRMLVNPRHGFYVVVPPQFNAWGAPPPSWYIDALMRDRPYYVGLLQASALHGAAHQAVMECQVVTDRQLRKLRAGRSWLTFHVRMDIEAVREGIVDYKTVSGTMKVSSPELTVLDLLRYAHAVGGLNAIARCLNDLGETVQGAKLAALAVHFDRTHVQRLGYLLEYLGHTGPARALHRRLADMTPLPWVALEPPSRHHPRMVTPLERSERWRVLVERYPEVDQ